MNATKFQRAVIPFAIVLSVAGTLTAEAASVSFQVPLSGAQCVPPVDTAAQEWLI